MPVFSDPPGFDDDAAPQRYIILASIAPGGMGEAFRAWDRLDGRLVAIKRPKAALLEMPGFLERFDREAQMLRRMEHPNIVPITDVGTLDGRPFFAMPFLPGGSLSARRLRDDQRKELPNHAGMLHLWLPQIAAALDHLHAHGVVHRDVKPGNIFFDVFWHSFLGDFGVAKVVDEGGGVEREQTLTGTHVALGTEFYMAAEMFSPRPQLTAGIDQYALAVTVYELLAGRRPFTGESTNLIVEVTTQSPPPLNGFRSDLPASLVHAVHRGLSKRPEDRFSSCGEFCQAALAHVQPLTVEPDLARLACPKCTHIIRISTHDAGRTGKCPNCRKRLVIAEDLSGLWTREEQEIVSAQLAGNSVAATAVEPISGPDVDNEPFDFKPLSKSVPVKKRSLVTRPPTRFLTVAIAAVSILGLGVLAWILNDPDFWVPRAVKWRIDTAARIEIDDKRLVAFGPVGFNRSPKSREHLVEYTRHQPEPIQIRVLERDRSDGRGKTVKLGDVRMQVWPSPDGMSCSRKVGSELYTVEVVAPRTNKKSLERLCILVAKHLKPGDQLDQDSEKSQRTGLKVEFFRDRNLQSKIQYPDPFWNVDLQINWGVHAAVNGLPPDNFSIRWTGFFIPKSDGYHRFVGYRDNGLRIWLNDTLMVDEWNDHWGEFTGKKTISLRKGKPYPIKIEYYEHNGGAGLTVKVKEEIGEAEVLGPSQLRPAP